MPSNKDKVASYLEDSEIQALDKFCEEKNCSRSQGVAHLINERLIESSRTLETEDSNNNQEQRIGVLETGHLIQLELNQKIAKKNEKLEELIAELQDDVYRLKAQIDDSAIHCLSDEQIASVTGRRPEEVYDWRMGNRKPRGKNILAKLEPYEIVDGLWKKKSI